MSPQCPGSRPLLSTLYYIGIHNSELKKTLHCRFREELQKGSTFMVFSNVGNTQRVFISQLLHHKRSW